MSSDGIKWQPIDGLARRKRGIGSIMCERGEGEIEKAKTQTAGCAEHMKQRNYAEQRAEIPVLSRDRMK